MSRINGQPHMLGQQLQQMQINHIRFPVASPSVLVQPTPTGPAVHIIGGLTKLEDAAIKIAAGMAAVEDDPDVIADKALTIASVLLEKAIAAQNPPVPPQEPAADGQR